MLNRDIVRVRRRGEFIEPAFLTPTPAVMALAEPLLAHWVKGVGRTRGALEDEAVPILHGSRALLVGKGLQKVLLDGAVFTDPPPRTALRAKVFAASVAQLRCPGRSAEDHRVAVAASLDMLPQELHEQLYDDLPDRAVLTEVPGWTVERWLERYNTALVQGLLLDAVHVDIEVERDLGRLRGLLRGVRFRRLVATTRARAGGWTLSIDGPGAVLDQATAYGGQLAGLLPILVGLGGSWRLRCELHRKDGAGFLVIDNAAPMFGQMVSGFIPEILRDLAPRLTGKLAGWTVEEAEPMTLPDGEVVAPDFVLCAPGRRVSVELCSRWHGAVARRRIGQIAAGLLPNFLLGLDRALGKRAATADLLTAPMFERCGFLMTDTPSPSALAGALAKLPMVP